MRSHHPLAWIVILALLLPLPALLEGGQAYAAHGTAGVSGGPVGNPFPITGASVSEETPAVAYNSSRREYLVVWENKDLATNDDIYGQRLSAAGTLAGEQFTVAAGSGTARLFPDVAYNSEHNEYLVVWDDSLGIRGQLVGPTNQLLGGPLDIALNNPATNWSCDSPAVGYASTADRYLVVFICGDAAGSQFQARALTSDGSPEGPAFNISPVYSGALSVVTPWYRFHDLAYNRRRNEFLVVWTPAQHPAYDIYGRLVKMQGGAAPGGSVFPIDVDPAQNDYNPAVAALPLAPDGQYLVAWTTAPPASPYQGDIRAQRIGGGGAPQGPLIDVSSAPESQPYPDVAGNEAIGQYLVVWNHGADVPGAQATIHGRALDSEGNILGPDPVLGGFTAGAVAVTSGPGRDFLVAFEEYLSSINSDLLGRLWGDRPRVYLPQIVRKR